MLNLDIDNEKLLRSNPKNDFIEIGKSILKGFCIISLYIFN